MVALPIQYNVADIPDTGGATLIPEGQYQATIVKSELLQTKSGDGQFLALTVVVTKGPHVNTEFTERLNIINKNQAAVQIAFKTLARISEAVGMTQTPSDSVQLHNKPLLIDVVTEKGEEWTDKNGIKHPGSDKSVIKKYRALPKQAPVFQAAPVAAPAAFDGDEPTTSAPATPPWVTQGV